MRMVIPLAGLLVLLFFARLTFTDHILARGDTYAYFYPYWAVRDAHLQAGELPLWTSDVFMGAPLLANSQLGTFYPPNWLTIYQSPPDAIRISILIHVFWAILGVLFLARKTLELSPIPALMAGIVFGLGGYIGSHVEQINQLQGLSWMPWLFLCLHLAMQKRRYWLILGVLWALQLLSGHTQTVFITGVGLGVYGIIYNLIPDNKTVGAQYIAPAWGKLISTLIGLILSVLIAITLALPQLIPTQGLISQSNRGGGLTAQQATAFSLDPTMIGRGLLPSYDGQPFGEYVAYMGIIGLALAITGVFAPDRRKWAWIGLGALGFGLALGRFNPLYYSVLAEIPGFNLFRVPARWLALYALGGAMLIGLGAQTFMTHPLGGRRRIFALGMFIIICAGLIIVAQFADRATEPVVGSSLPTLTTWIGWGLAVVVAMLIIVGTTYMSSLRASWIGGFIAVALIVELFFAGQYLPHQDLTDPNAYDEARFAINQLRAYQTNIPPDRFLSISAVYFDPGDKASLQARWADMGLSPQAQTYAFTATKLKEVVASNLPLIWRIPTIDGFDGGVLPTANYTAFTSLLLPDGALRTVDGRLRENLALPACGGACIPDDRWLDLTNTRYLLTDKVYDVVHEGIFFDTQFKRPTGITWDAPYDFSADEVQVLFRCDGACESPQILVDDSPTPFVSSQTLIPPTTNGDQLALYRLDEVLIPQTITPLGEAITIVAITLVDSRTGDFLQIHPTGWARVYSADIKIYENLDVMPRAFMVYDAQIFPDTWDGTELALAVMRDEAFNPLTSITINTNDDLAPLDGAGIGHVTITRYTSTEIVMTIETDMAGYVVLSDATYPNWVAQVDGIDAPILRADVMFRAVYVKAGTHEVVFRYVGW